MAEVVFPGQPTSHATLLGSVHPDGDTPVDAAGEQESGDPIPRAIFWDWQQQTADLNARPSSASMHIDIPSANPPTAHSRTSSTLPNFSFNAADTSGRHDSRTPPRTPEETKATTPSRAGHRRGGSEFVGGDSRLGMSSLVSSSPTKTSPTEATIPATTSAPPRRGHAHRRSAAISSNDVVKLMQPTNDERPRLSSSLPNSPLEYPGNTVPTATSLTSPSGIPDPFGPPLEEAPARPPSRPRVGFSDNVEFIPRPLSTISSETESSISTIRGHSVNTSISSLLSLSTPSPPASRTVRTPLRANSGDEVKPAATASPVKPRRVEKEGQWLKRRSSESLQRPASESAVHTLKTTFVDPQPNPQMRKRSFSNALGFDRRRSEPSFRLSAGEPSRRSTISLQEATSRAYGPHDVQDARATESKSSVRRMKDWATAKISKKAKEASRVLTANSSSSSLRPVSAGSVPSLPPREWPEPAVAETDLDAVLSHPDASSDAGSSSTPTQRLAEINLAASNQHSGTRIYSYDDSEAVLDLDAALGPFKTPPIGSHRMRKEMHSSRLAKDFTGPGGHYHRRAESAPNLAPFEYQQEGNPSQTEMADVFEEEEEESMDNARALGAIQTSSSDDVEADRWVQGEMAEAIGQTRSSAPRSLDGLGLQESYDTDRSSSPSSLNRPSLSNLILEGRGSSIMEETIMEEGGPEHEVEIVDADEEPRASSLTKSSDSSDTPTLLAIPAGTLTLPNAHQSLGTSDGYQSVSSPSSMIRPGSLSSCTTGEQSQDMRSSVEVPSLTSSRSTANSTMHGNGSRRDVCEAERASSVTPHPEELSGDTDSRRKRGSIQSLSQLVGGSLTSLSSRTRGTHEPRPQTSGDTAAVKAAVKKENRLKKLVFWKSKRQPRQHDLPSKT